MPRTTDEDSYVLQANNFASGRIALPCPPLAGVFYHEMIILDDQAGWLSRYSPGHSLWLMWGCFIGHPFWMVCLSAALSVWLMARTGALFGPGVAWSATLLLLLSPFFLFTHGTLLSHTTGMLSSMILLYAFLRWHRSGTWYFALLAGLGWGWLYLIRTYTALWVALPFGVFALTRLWSRRHEPQAWLGTILFAGVAACGVAVLLLYNYLAVGDPFTMTYLYYNPMEQLGFGMRANLDGTYLHTWSNGLAMLWKNLKLLTQWLWGFPAAIPALLVLMVIGWNRWTPWLLAAPLLVMAGYIGFYYYGPYDTGPGYYFETIPYFLLAAAFGLARLFDAARVWPPWARGCTLLLLLAALILNLRFQAREGIRLHEGNRLIAQLRACLRQAPPDALVIADQNVPFSRKNHGLLIFNPNGSDSQPLVARSMGEMTPLICRMFPGRKPYRLTYDGTPRLAPYSAPWHYNIWCSCNAATNQTGRREPSNKADQSQFAAQAGRDAPGWLARGVRFPIYPGRFAMEFDLSVDSAAPTQRVVTVEVALGKAVLPLKRLDISSSIAMPTIIFDALDIGEIEPRVFYHGTGNAVCRGFRLRELSQSYVDETDQP